MDATDITSALGAFTSANFHVVNSFNGEFDKKKEEITKLKEELKQTRKEHEAHVVDLMKISKDKCNELHVKNTSLQDELLSDITANDVFV